jgi:photosystem II stability/assembly factor-like uncharacterized protein
LTLVSFLAAASLRAQQEPAPAKEPIPAADPAQQPDSPPPDAENKPKPDEVKPDESKTADTKPEAPKPEDQKPSDDKPADDKPSDDKPAEQPDESPAAPKHDYAKWIAALKWRSIGPSSMGGRIVDLAVDPSDSATYYVGTASGGVFKTTNRGVTFAPVFDQAGSLSIGDVCISPSHPDTVWVGTGEHNARNSVTWGDGVYKSTDGGRNWKQMGLRDSFQIGRIAVHPTSPDVVFVGAAGRLWGPSEERGLYKSTDGGQTWKQVLYVDEHTGCIDVAISPGDPKVMLAAMYQRRRDPFDGGDPVERWGPGSGLFRSDDGGETWQRLSEGLPTVAMGRIGVAWSGSNPQTALAIIETEQIGVAPEGAPKPAFVGISGGGNAPGGGAQIAQVLREGPAADAGLQSGDVITAVDDVQIANYQQFSAQIESHAAGDKVKLTVRRDKEELAIDFTFGERPRRGSGPDRAYAANLGGQLANKQDRQGPNGYQTGGVYKSVDGGITWERINSANPRPFYYSQIHIDPSDEKYVYVLGITIDASRDGGHSFRTAGRGVHPDHHALWIDPADGRRQVLGCDGGLFETHDRGATWEFINTLPIGQFYHVAVDSRRMYRVYGGLQDNGSWGGPSALRGGVALTEDEWRPIYGGDGFVCQVDRDDPDLVYYEMQYGGMGRVNVRTGQRAAIRPPRVEGKNYRFNWKTPFILSHHNPRIFYSAGNYVFRSLDRGEDLRIISPELTRHNKGTITAIAESPRDPDVLYAGTDDGLLWITRDGGNAWSELTEKLGLDGPRRISSIECSRYADGRTYITLDGHYYNDDAPHVLLSEDFGESWQPLDGGLPSGSARVVREDLQNENLLYLGTEFGAWASLDRGASWHSLCTNLPRVAVHELAQHRAAGELIAGTHGRGIWILDVSALRRVDKDVAAADAHLFESAEGVLWSGAVGKRLYGSKRHVGENPSFGAVFYYALAKPAEKVELKIVDIEGRQVRELDAEKNAGLHRVMWDLRADRRRNAPFGGAAPAGTYRLVLTVGDREFSRAINVTPDPEFPTAPTMLEMEEEEYYRTLSKQGDLAE